MFVLPKGSFFLRINTLCKYTTKLLQFNDNLTFTDYVKFKSRSSSIKCPFISGSIHCVQVGRQSIYCLQSCTQSLQNNNLWNNNYMTSRSRYFISQGQVLRYCPNGRYAQV
jgi:hypothetical protein